jgi:hypothetical protein
MRPDIEERRLLVRDVAAQLTEIAAQKPDAVFAVKERRYHALVDRVEYDADNNTAIVEVVWNL